MHYRLIESDALLQQVCDELAVAGSVSLDTEFIRTRTYWPRLALLQLHAPGKGIWLIDPLALTDLTPLEQLLAEAPRLLMHACGEDLEALQHGLGQLPAHLFDTQLAAAFAGLGQSVGYARLVEQFCGVTLDKEEARTDWLARPLTERQLAYAANDVRYLPALDKALTQRLLDRDLGRLVIAEGERLIQRQLAPRLPEQAYLDVKNAWRLKAADLAVLRGLTAWREEECRRRDVARSFVVKDDVLLQLSQRRPRSRALLAELGVHPALIKRSGEQLLAVISQAAELDPGQWPATIRRIIDIPGSKQALARLKQAVSEVAEQSGVPAEMLASKRMLSQYLGWHYRCGNGETDPTDTSRHPEVLGNWRRAFLQEALEKAIDA